MNADVTYRVAVAEDIPKILELRKKLLIAEGQEPSVNIDEALLSFYTNAFRQENIYMLFAEQEGEVIATGSVLFYEFPPSYFMPSGKKAYIANCYTRSAYRGQGLAHEILTKLKEEAHRRGVDQFFLIASPMGKPVYEDLGFHENSSWLTL